MIVKIGSFSKRHNSTKQPDNSWGTTLSDVELKEDTSLEEPVFRIGFANWDTAYNYIYVPSWGRYYFVIDVTVRIGRIWEVSCRLDAAATYKADIQATTAFILYDATANTDLIDSRLMITTPAITEYVETPLSDYLNTTGVYCLSVVGACDNVSGTQGARTYALSIGALKNVLSSVQQYIADLGAQDTDSKEAILSIGRQLVGAGNVMENIRGCTWIPWNVSAMGDVSNEGIWLGLFDTGKAGYAIDVPVKSYETSISIPWHFTDWRRNSPYTQVYLYIPFVGLVQLSSENLIGQSVVYVKVSINRLNGNCDFEVRAGNQIIGTYSATTGIGIPVGVSGISGETAGVGALAHVASMAVGGAAGAIAGAVAQISQIAPNVITAGNLSGGAAVGLNLNLRCYTISHNTSAEPNTIAPVIGTPVFAHHSLSGKSGFVQTRDISIQGANMSDAVRQELNAMCDNGIFIE